MASYRNCKWCGKKYEFVLGSDFSYCSVRCKTQAEKNKTEKNKEKSSSNSKVSSKSQFIFWGVIIVIGIIYVWTHNEEKAPTTTTPFQVETTTIPKKGTKAKAKPIEVKQEIALEAVTFDEISNEEKQTLKTLVQKWSTAHNESTINDFNSLFDDFVQFYGTRLSKESCIENKETLLLKYPDFQQQIYGNIDIEQTADNECRCNFTKHVTVNQKTTDYPSYLGFKKTSNQWKIIAESDLVTDKNLAKKKK